LICPYQKISQLKARMPTKKQLQEENTKLKARLADGDKVDEWIGVIATHVMHAQELNVKIDELEGFMPDGYEFYIDQGLSMNDIIEKMTKKNDELKEQFNNLIDLIKGADTEEKINKLKELDHLE
jgi:hypothetical protein